MGTMLGLAYREPIDTSTRITPLFDSPFGGFPQGRTAKRATDSTKPRMDDGYLVSLNMLIPGSHQDAVKVGVHSETCQLEST